MEKRTCTLSKRGFPLCSSVFIHHLKRGHFLMNLLGRISGLVVLSTLLSIPCFAGEFRVSCFSELNDCSSIVTDIITDKFIAHFPASHWKIVVIAEFQPYSDGGGVGFAIAGISPAPTPTLAPLHRFTATTRIVDRRIGPYDRTSETRELIRRAVENLMSKCDLSQECDVYTPYK